MRIIIAE